MWRDGHELQRFKERLSLLVYSKWYKDRRANSLLPRLCATRNLSSTVSGGMVGAGADVGVTLWPVTGSSVLGDRKRATRGEVYRSRAVLRSISGRFVR